MSKAAFALLWCFIFVLPWDVVTQLPILGSIPRVVGVVASVVGILHILARRRVRPLSWFHVFAVLFVLWAGVTSLWSLDPDATRTRFLTYLQLLVLAWLIWEIAWSPGRQRVLLSAYVLGSGAAAVATISNYLSGVGVPFQSDVTRYGALNQNANDLGLILALGLPMAWYLSLSQPNRRIGWMWQLYVPLASTAILLTASRGSFLTALVALVIIPWTQGRLPLRTKIPLYALVVGALVIASKVVPESSLERIGSTRADIEAAHFGGRGAIWIAGLEVAREHPVVGVGAGAFEAAVATALQGDFVAHQVLLSILVEDGIVGLVLFLAMVGATLSPLRHLPPLRQRFSIVLLLALAVGSLSISWDHRKQFWFVLGILAAQVAQRPAWPPVLPAVAMSSSSRVRLAAKKL